MIRHVCKEAFFLFQLPLNKNFSHGDLPYCQSYYKSDISDDKKSLGLSFPADVLASFGLHHPACLYQAASCPGPVVLVLFPSPRQVIVTTSTAVAFGKCRGQVHIVRKEVDGTFEDVLATFGHIFQQRAVEQILSFAVQCWKQ